MFTVKDLITRLRNYDPNQEVYIMFSDWHLTLSRLSSVKGLCDGGVVLEAGGSLSANVNETPPRKKVY